MAKTTDDMVRIASASGGMRIKSNKTTDDLVRIASAASGKNVRIIISGSYTKTTDDLVRIAAAGKGCVLFDLDF